ncbi:MAG: helix-turn-helix domain-containing protein [Mesorhizobium sp.]|uniref:helix-turn-helix transcriptional regulator n=1 Tax=Mesorhizobium sp. TaxID=1871066 RepID=UPI000FE8BCA7|nr:AraC family transcriptional regulator [Mesorhizobium sp.]RWN37252.1 MAG: AraC family transcriptional regulator [Mesorhizobium sp.]RWQ41141.1 MAG: AraC family transcriptional regulator [Mesorhizobium sp.]TIL27934.1 MAG: helix-turn-helix domain-containing protein [Mesorhizobium sp.]
MASSAAEFASICFSTEGLPEPDRFEFWREVLGRAITKFEIDPVPDSSPDASITLRALPGVDIASGAAAGMQYRRTPALIDSDDIVLFVALSGAQTVDQIGRECTISAGEAALFACAEPGLAIPRERQHRLAFRTPHDVLAPMVGNVEDAICKPIPSTVDSLRLLVSYAATLEDVDQPLTPAVANLAATHIQDLVALAIGATRDAAAIAEGRGLRAARLKAVKADIVSNLGYHDLTVGAVALRQGVTPRCVQKLFETEGRTFSSFVLDQRLARARRLLSDPRYTDWTISSIAFEAGFGDLSYFHRAFRRLYGATPSDIRQGTLGF